jgi:histone H3/H4
MPRQAVATNQETETMTDKKEVLVVASKVKTYIREKSDMNTSAGVFDVLSDKLREMCDRAIENARNDGRKTVKDRDFS